MLGLPDGVTACLSGMDGVVTRTAVVRDAAWKEMFDDFPRQWPARAGKELVPFDPVRTMTNTWTANRGSKAPHRSWSPGTFRCRPGLPACWAPRLARQPCSKTRWQAWQPDTPAGSGSW